jgi:hypothetical protein
MSIKQFIIFLIKFILFITGYILCFIIIIKLNLENNLDLIKGLCKMSLLLNLTIFGQWILEKWKKS